VVVGGTAGAVVDHVVNMMPPASTNCAPPDRADLHRLERQLLCWNLTG